MLVLALDDVGNWEGGETRMLYRPHQEGQGLVEYMLIILLVAIVVIVALQVAGPIIGNMFSTISTKF